MGRVSSFKICQIFILGERLIQLVLILVTNFLSLPLYQLSENQFIFQFSLSVNHCNDTDLSNNIKKKTNMEVIAIESKTFDLITDRFENFAKQIKQWCGVEQENNKWLDNQDVCTLLNISYRTLQYYRNAGKLSFSQINSKCYYKVEDVEKLLKDSLISKQNKQ